MFELIPYQKFRDTPSVRFFDITIPNSNARDLVFHDGPAVSPNNTSEGFWQFYMHPHQEDNLLALTGGRTFYLVNFSWDYPFHMVRLEANGHILRIPPGTFHRSVSDPTGSLVLNQAVRTAEATVETEFRVYNSGQIPRLLHVTSKTALPPKMHGFDRVELRVA
ncbi:MAG TPA: redox protein [Synechococcales cyanobacterium M55_K2018_004]|nr:redox protein [Synechococcales cyanobacterium M55_K2018_004]